MLFQDWKNLFPKTILSRGKAYQEAGKVKKIQPTKDGFQITVRGTKTYQVHLRTEGETLRDLNCTCPYAQDGRFCKHMAAACYELENYHKAAVQKQEKGSAIQEEAAAGSSAGNKVAAGSSAGKKAAEGYSSGEGDVLELLRREQREIRDREREEGVPVPEDLEDDSYFRPERFREGLMISDSVLKKAKALISAGKIRLESVQLGYARGGLPSAGQGELIGIANAENQESVLMARIAFSRDRIQNADCGDWRCRTSHWNSRSYLGHDVCEHEAAAILLTEDYLRENRPGDATSQAGDELMQRIIFSRGLNATKQQKKSAELLSLRPTLEWNSDGELTVSFRVGSGKLYKIRDLRDFWNNVRYHQKMQFGTKTMLALGSEYLDDVSLGWYQYLEDVLKEEDQRYERTGEDRRSYYSRFYAPTEPRIKGEIPLYGNRLDQFYERIPESGIDAVFNLRREKKQLHLFPREESLRLRLVLESLKEKETGYFLGVRLKGTVPDILEGVQAAYILREDSFCRIGMEEIRRCQPLLQAAEAGQVSLTIGRRHMADFYYKILPVLREFADIEEREPERIARYLPGEPAFFVYLDVEEGQVLARADVVYGRREFSLVERLNPDRGDRQEDEYRDGAAEAEVLEVLLRYLPEYDPVRDQLCGGKDEAEIFELLDHGLEELMEVAEVHSTERFKRLGIRRHVKFSLGVSLESNLLDLSVTSEDLSREELLEILYSYKRKKRFVRLKNGDFLKLEESETIGGLAEMMEALRLTPKQFVSGKMHVPAYRALYLDKMLEQMQDVYADRDRFYKKLIKGFKTMEDADYEVPASLKGVLRKYQQTGYRWLRTLDEYGFGGILADEMGLGKTLQVIAVLLSAKQEVTDNLPSLVVCPASLVYNWEEELARFAPALSVCRITGTKAERNEKIRDYLRYDVLVTSYDLLKRDIDQYEGKRFAYEVIDEAQYIKNQQTAAAKAVKLVESRTRFALTGTPIENRLSELWSIFDYLMPGFLYDYGTFRSDFETPIVKYGQEEANQVLRRMAGPFILRRKKEDVLKDLPAKLEEVRYAGMEEKQRRLYDGQVVKMRNTVAGQKEEEFRRNRIQILAELTRIRQICCDPGLFLADYDGGSAKRESCLELLKSVVEGGHKALLFSQFTSMLELLKADLDREGIPYYVITGATPKEKRMELVKAFNGDDTPVFLISLKAGGTGLNLTGADVVIHYDPWWNLAVQNQATDRAHRIGQTKPVTVYKLIVKNTIEEKILEMQEAKRKLAEDILSSEAAASASFSREELLALLQ